MITNLSGFTLNQKKKFRIELHTVFSADSGDDNDSN